MSEKMIILNIITSHFLNSGDFNGLPLWRLTQSTKIDGEFLHTTLLELVSSGVLSFLDESMDINPAIIRYGFLSKQGQIEILKKMPLNEQIFFYPTAVHLANVVNSESYSDFPYRLALAYGEAQLVHRYFDLSILENYRNDPRYSYYCDDISGSICSSNDQMSDKERNSIQDFGFAYGDNRAVAVSLRDLSKMNPDHQKMWQTKELDGNYNLHPGYVDILKGIWSDYVSVFNAFLQEIYLINRMCEAMGRTPLFRDEYGEYGEKRPKEFAFLVRPTLNEYNDFIQILDKLLTDNIDKSFFLGDINFKIEKNNDKGQVEITPKGSLLAFDEWLRINGDDIDWSEWDKHYKALKDIRKQRSKPSHKITDDEFDHKYFGKQKDIMIKAYCALRFIRRVFALHPEVKAARIAVPEGLDSNKIWTV